MDDERLDALFEEALTIPASERVRWLDVRCSGDSELRRSLERLLKADAHAEGVLERAPQLLAEVMADAVEVPVRFGIWRVTGALGAGGMGEVWLAERDDGQFRQRVAIKQVAWPTPGLLRRFREEREILARLEHPGISRLIDGGMAENGCPWLAMEYVEGVPITQWVREHMPSVRGTIDLVLQICDAVQFAHRNLIVHSDIKPSNILVSKGVPKLLDFGVAKVLSQDDSERTRTVAQLLTPDYAAPELLAGGTITTSVDVYALGVLSYELLSGCKPYRVSVLAGTASPIETNIKPPGAAVDHTLPDAKARRRVLRGDLDRIVMKAMAREPPRRYATVEALSADLRNWLAGRAINARGQGRWYRAGKFVARHRIGFATTLLTFAVLIAATIYSLREARLAQAQAARANAVRDFVVGVFEQADPDKSQGQPISARGLLGFGERQLDNESRSQPFHTEMQGLLGYLYWQVGERGRGNALLRAVVTRPAEATPSEVRAQNLLYLAQTEVDDNLFPVARKHAGQAWAVALQSGDAGRPIASEAQLLYANILVLQGDTRTARKILSDALQENTSRFGPRSMQVARSLANLALADEASGLYRDAIADAQQAIAIVTAVQGRASSENLINLLTSAEAKTESGNPTGGQEDMREAVAIATRVYGRTHPYTISMRANLYVLYAGNEQYAEALAGQLDLIRMIQHNPNRRPGHLLYAWYGAALDYAGLGRYEEAAHAAREGLADWARMPNPDPDYYIRNYARAALANAMLMMGRLDEAEAGYLAVTRSQSRHSAPHSELASLYLAQLGNVYRLQHRHAEAVATTDKALAMLSAKSGVTPRRARIEILSALAQLDAGNLAAATAMAAQATRAADIVFKDQPLALSFCQYMNARVALAQHRPSDAEALLRAAWKARSALPSGDPLKVEVQVGLIRALEMQGKRDEAKTLRAQVEPVLAASRSPYFADLRRFLLQR